MSPFESQAHVVETSSEALGAGQSCCDRLQRLWQPGRLGGLRCVWCSSYSLKPFRDLFEHRSYLVAWRRRLKLQGLQNYLTMIEVCGTRSGRMVASRFGHHRVMWGCLR